MGIRIGNVLGDGGALLARQPFANTGHAGRAGDGQGTALVEGGGCEPHGFGLAPE